MRYLLGLLALLIATSPLLAQSAANSPDAIKAPRNVTFCDLAKDPAAYNHEQVRLTAFVTHGFEDFHLAEPACAASEPHFSVWVMYGGNAESNTAYCCPGEGGRETRPETLTVEGVQVPLVNDSTFRRFTDLLKKEPDTTVRVTVLGNFFSGTKQPVQGTFWRGFGHMGCCSLFVIQRVESFEPHARDDLDYTSEAGWYEKEGCNYRSLRYIRHIAIPYGDGTAEQAIAEQKAADSGQAPWAFSDPERVAVESLKIPYSGQKPVLRSLRKTSARQVFQWKNEKKSVVVVVIRPYWLSFYAASGSVAWVSTTIKEAECH